MKFGLPYLVKAKAAAGAVLPNPINGVLVFTCSELTEAIY